MYDIPYNDTVLAAPSLPVARTFYESERIQRIDPFVEELNTGRNINIIDIDQCNMSRAITLMHYLEHRDPKARITLSIMSNGGSVHAGLALIDAARACHCEVVTLGYGICASMGAMILACAAHKGNRYLMPSTEMLTHQLLSGVEGQQTDISIQAEHLAKMREKLDSMLAEATGKSLEDIKKITERDTWFTAEEAVAYGLADRIVGQQEEDHDN